MPGGGARIDPAVLVVCRKLGIGNVFRVNGPAGVAALGFGTDDADYERWWNNTSDRVHVVGKGILRFHAISWPAMLLSAGFTFTCRS